MAVNVNDIVRFLNQVGGGRVTKVEGNIAYVEDEDGFEQPVQTRECVVVESGTPKPKPTAYDRPKAPTPSKEVKVETPKPLPVEETPEGDKLNIVLAYEAEEIKHLNTTAYNAYIVNDSNYYLYFSYMARGNDDGEWHTRFAGIVEPNIQVLLEEFTHADLIDMDRVAVQYIAYKEGKGFKLKNPALVEYALDTTKFYKTHCFHDNEYFDTPVISLDIVKNDVPLRINLVDSTDLERAMKMKKHVDDPKRRQVEKHDKKKGEIIECDLHITELIDSTAGLSNKDMLDVQLEEFHRVMDANINHHGSKIVFIHGKGEGVLRKAIIDELHKKYPHCEAQDASFREYGFGATLVKIKA